MSSSAWSKTRSDLANAVRFHLPDTEVAELRQRLKAERLEAHVREIVDSAPPLTDEQCARIAALLRPAGDHAD
jgi:hypothetical protein